MKLFVISDIHGSYKYAKMAVDRFKNSGADKLLILGDLYYHGPRNPLPEGYDPLKVCELLNSLKPQIIALKGNCDAEVDQMISEFRLKEEVTVKMGDKVIRCAHGHRKGPENLPREYFDLFLFGHFHVHAIENVHRGVIASPGSISLPKDDFRSYMIVDDRKIAIYDLLNGAFLAGGDY